MRSFSALMIFVGNVLPLRTLFSPVLLAHAAFHLQTKQANDIFYIQDVHPQLAQAD
jgi:hypothetical protein